MASVLVKYGDLLDQEVDAIVNPWNRNIIPWFLLLPHGVSGAIRKRAGRQPFRELGRLGPIQSGSAVVTSAGKLDYKGIIHVCGLTWYWTTNEKIVRLCVESSIKVAVDNGYKSIAFPLIGAGVGGLSSERVREVISDAATPYLDRLAIRIVIFKRN
ncbi:MAG: macro domain-containing protein [Phycisphaerales bacterium]|nr:macro domain-containing protein [Phycisphaerales bacterium]